MKQQFVFNVSLHVSQSSGQLSFSLEGANTFDDGRPFMKWVLMFDIPELRIGLKLNCSPLLDLSSDYNSYHQLE